MVAQIAKNENYHPVVALALALAATFGTYMAVTVSVSAESYIHDLFFERSWIQYFTTFTFWMAIALLAIRFLKWRFESQGFRAARKVLDSPELASTFIWSDAARIRALFVEKAHAAHQDTLAFTRIINALDRLQKTQSTKELDDYFRTRSEMDFGELETSYSGLRYLIWLIPTLGFLGTVMGIGLGIAGFSAIIENAENFQAIKEALPMVTLQLGTAFDTTLLALVLCALCMMYQSSVLKNEEALLGRIDALCLDGVCALFREHSEEFEKLTVVVRELTDNVKTAMSGNRAEVTRVVVDELPSRMSADLVPRLERLVKYLASVVAKAAESDTVAARSNRESAEQLQQQVASIAQRQEAAREALGALSGEVGRLTAMLGRFTEESHALVQQTREIAREMRQSRLEGQEPPRP